MIELKIPRLYKQYFLYLYHHLRSRVRYKFCFAFCVQKYFSREKHNFTFINYELSKLSLPRQFPFNMKPGDQKPTLRCLKIIGKVKLINNPRLWRNSQRICPALGTRNSLPCTVRTFIQRSCNQRVGCVQQLGYRETQDLINGLALGCYQPSPEV